MHLLDWFLSKIGLMRKTKHEVVMRDAVSKHKDFLFKLGVAAKQSGVGVVFEREYHSWDSFAGDVFILGDKNIMVGVIVGGKVLISPFAENNQMDGVISLSDTRIANL